MKIFLFLRLHRFAAVSVVVMVATVAAVGAGAAGAAGPAGAVTGAPAGETAVPPYEPQPVAPPPADAPYLLADGSIHYAGNDLVAVLFGKLSEIFVRTHPGFKFQGDMQDSNLALPGIISGKSAFGPIGRDAIRQELDGFTARYGYPPSEVLIGYDQSPDTDIFPPGKTPAAIWINTRNPLPKLTVAQVGRILKSGGAGGDITHWSQLGIGGEWAKREIHVYLPGNRDAAFLFTMGYRMGDRPFTRRAEWLPSTRDVMSAVAQDPFGIGVIGFWPPDAGWDRQHELGGEAKIVALAADDESRFSRAAPGDLYAFTPGIHIYFNRRPGQRIEPWLKEYLRLALSPEGQALVTAMAVIDTTVFIRLQPGEAERELEKLK